MRGIINLCARRPVTVIMLIAAVFIAAVYSSLRLPLDKLPEISVPRVTVETVYSGMAAADVRTLVTIPVEDALSPVKGLERIRSISRDGRSLVSLDFNWGTDPMAASALVREAIDAVYPSLPQGALKPTVTPADSGNDPHAIIAVRSLRGDDDLARRLADYELRSRLRKLDGAGLIVLVGGDVPEQRLRLDDQKLAALGLNPPGFVNLLSKESADIPAGNARDGDTELVVVSSGRPQSVQELNSLLLPLSVSNNGTSGAAITPGDIGNLGLESGRRNSVFVFDGREAAALEVYRRRGADPLRLSRDIRKILKEAGALFSRDAEITLVTDSAPALIRGIRVLSVSAALGAAAVLCVLFMFIRRIRLSLLVALSIPASAAAGICVLALTGRSLNSMSLGGLALGIGMVSDTSVIVLDLLHRAFGSRNEKPSPEDIGGRAASIAGSSAASTLTTSVVFVPVIFLPGPLGSLFGDTAIALVSSITAGWLYAQFCLPSLYLLFFNGVTRLPLSAAAKKMTHNSFSALSGLETKYRRMLAPVLRRPLYVMIFALLASIAGGVLLMLRPAAFVSPDEAEEIQVSVVFPPGTVLELAGKTGAEISRRIAELSPVKNVYGRAGAAEEDIGRRADIDYRRENLVFHCVLKSGVKPEQALAEISRMTESLELPDKTEITVRLPADKAASLLGLSSEQSFVVRGTDHGQAAERAALAASQIKKEASDSSLPVSLRPHGSRPELRFYPGREAVAYIGLSAADIAETLYILNEGAIATQLEIDGRPLDVRVSGKKHPENFNSEVLLENIPVMTANGKPVHLGSLGSIERRESDAALARLDRSDVIYLDIPVSQNNSLGSALKKTLKHFSWFSRAAESVFSRYRNSLLLTVCLALILLYMTMGAQFESFVLPFVLMLTIPFSVAGAGPALLLFGGRLDSGAALGLTALFGLVVNNGLVLFEISDENIRSGLSPAAAVYSGAGERLKPVLITSATTILALLPFALNPLANSQKSMSAAMLGGLAASTLLSLFALPPVFVKFFRWREK